MAGNLFPETYIGDSEDVYKKAPAGKKKNTPLSRDVRSASPRRANAGQQNSDRVAGAGELSELSSEGEGHPHREADATEEEEPVARSSRDDANEGTLKHPNPQCPNLLDLKWVEEKDGGKEEPRGENVGSPPGTRSSPEELGRSGACSAQEVLWPPPGDDTQENLKPRLNEVSVIDSFVPEEKLPTSTGCLTPGGPGSSPGDQEGSLCDEEEAPPSPASASTGYFPCYRTYVELPRYHPPGADGQPEGTASRRDASVQCSQPEEAAGGERKKAEANSNSKGVKVLLDSQGSPRRQPRGGSRPGSAGKRRDGSGRNPRPYGESSPEGMPKARSSGGSPTRPGAARDEPVPCPRASPSPPAALLSRKSPQRKKHRAGPADEKEPGEATERKPLLADLRSLPPSPEEKAGVLPLCCYGAQAAGESRQVVALKEQREGELPPAPSSPPDLSGDPSPSPSRLSFHAIVSWVWRIFRKPASPPAAVPGAEAVRRPLAHRLRLWLAQRRGRVHPEPP